MKPFDHLKTDLDGRKLIESSAGTGKTYAIASLFVRLLLERGLPVHQILVVTFTEAATAELQARIRRRVREALQAFEGTAAQPDEFLSLLVERTKNREQAGTLLAQALYGFDQAAIFTIHGFCRKALQENAFESASPFDTELLADQRPICEQIVEDFWRTRFYPAPAALVGLALEKDFRRRLAGLAGSVISHPNLKVIPEVPVPDFSEVRDLETEAAQRAGALARIRADHSGSMAHLLCSHQGLKRNLYRPESIPVWLEELGPYLSSGNLLPYPKFLPRLCPAGLADGTRKGFAPPAHPFFDATGLLVESLDRLETAVDGCLLALKSEFLAYARLELPRRKRQRNVRSFDDLLLDLRDALKGPSGRALAASLRSRFKAALIDEFQDTDPVQYEIFRTIFDDDSSLFLIGDPKQAIYGFRGADIFAYMKAAEDVPDRFTLTRNRRSTPDLVAAVNALFRGKQAPFVFPEIRFIESEAAAADGGDCPGPPLKIWFMPREDETKPMPKYQAEAKVPGAVAADIVRLLNAGRDGRARIGGREVSPWDIAVLVRTNEQAQMIQRALSQRRVPSVVYGVGSVFETEEAVETERLLLAVADPGNEGRIKAALATSILGLHGDDFARLGEDDPAWEARLRLFSEYRDLWVEQGFVTMARTLLGRENVRERLLSLPGGERRLTNLLHCLELLQSAAVQEKLGVEGLLKWLAEQRRGGAKDAEAQQIRLETDEKALKVITVHKSKGLEFPIVYCPYTWSATNGASDQATFHDPASRTVLVKDLGSDDLAAHRSIQGREDLAEQCRLFYVALTRAKYRCIMAWGGVKDAGFAAPAYLLHYAGDPDAPGLAEAVQSFFAGLSDAQVLGDLEDLSRRSAGTVEIAELPAGSPECCLAPGQETPDFRAREFSGEIARDWGSASFSGWTAGRPHAAEMPDHDAAPADPGAEPAPIPLPAGRRTILDFPKGVRTGSCLHEIFQELDYACAGTQAGEELVRSKLEAFGFDPAWQATVCRMVRDVLVTPLDSEDEIVLGKLGGDRRLAELEFTFPLGRVTPGRLMEVFAAHPGAPVSAEFAHRLGMLSFAPVRGMMRGFIDLVFEWNGKYYLLDWKSNYLGPAVEDYSREALRPVMEKTFYVLQYHLYTVALDRYLARRVTGYSYERHFGGAFYLFLRGMDPGRGARSGVYHDKPPADRIAALGALL